MRNTWIKKKKKKHQFEMNILLFGEKTAPDKQSGGHNERRVEGRDFVTENFTFKTGPHQKK